MTNTIPANLIRFSGFADVYDRYRPSPPPVLVDVLTQLAEVARPKLVVDIGCGTGLSTRIWSGRADRIIGVEPNADMRRQAEAATSQSDVHFQDGSSTGTGLPSGCADIVTVVQALHWMEPEPTFAEIARILRPGRVFAAVDCDWPPTLNWEVEAAYLEFEEGVEQIDQSRGLSTGVKKWAKNEHIARMKNSGQFRFTKEIVMHQIEPGNADRLVGLAKSMGSVATLLKAGLSEDEIGLTKLREVAERVLGSEPRTWYFGYRVRVGVR